MFSTDLVAAPQGPPSAGFPCNYVIQSQFCPTGQPATWGRMWPLPGIGGLSSNTLLAVPNDTDSVTGLINETAGPVGNDAAADRAHGQAGEPLPDLDGPLFDSASHDFDFAFDGDPDEALPAVGNLEGGMVVLDDPERARRATQARQRRMTRSERRRRVKLQARRVRRIVRHIEPWSVLKISLLFYACLWLIFLVTGFMVWGVLEQSNTIENFENLVTDYFVLEDPFKFDTEQVFRGYALVGLVLCIAGTTFNVLMVLLFNLLSDLTGGLRITMIEEETARPTPPRKKRRRRRRSRVPR